ncbi:MAG: hypothetical protein L0227_12075 [Chloroflexi bacterium]|nr:hypothetical protein [Chloroflexota bacterium]
MTKPTRSTTPTTPTTSPSISSRLRLVLRQSEGGFVVAGPGEDGLQEVELVAYAAHGRLSGRIRLDRARLSDMLNDHDEFQLDGVMAMRLPEGHSRVIREMVVQRSELFLVHAGGPRGDRAQRTTTVPRAITVKCGPYSVTGDVHSPPGIDPLRFFERRRSMVPLTDAVVEYRTARGPVKETVEVVVVNRDLVDWVRRAVVVAPPAPVVASSRFRRARS